MEEQSDRRRFPRYPCTGGAEILQSGKSCGWGRVSDISRSGCYIETMHPLPTGDEAQLRLTIAGVFLEISANVVSSDPLFGMGMDFVVVPTEQWEKLSNIIETITDVDLSPAPVLQDGVSHGELRPHMQAALQHLQQAQNELRKSMYEKGEHCARALQLTENAIHEVTMACKRGSTIEATGPASIGRRAGWSFEVH